MEGLSLSSPKKKEKSRDGTSEKADEARDEEKMTTTTKEDTKSPDIGLGIVPARFDNLGRHPPDGEGGLGVLRLRGTFSTRCHAIIDLMV